MTTVARVNGLTHRYGDTFAVNNLDLEIPAGCMAGFIGPDGVGKSSLLALISGVRKIQDGVVQVLDGDMRSSRHRSKVCPRIAYMPQGLGKNLYMTLSVFENVDFFGRLFGQGREERERRIKELLASTGLTPFRDRPAGKLSGGMKQKLALACTLIHSPKALLLDEPTTGVDPVTRREFWRLLADLVNEGLTLFIATPYLDEAERCTRVLLMHEGTLLADSRPQEIPDMMPGTILELTATPRATAADILSAHSGIADVSVFGTTLHVHIEGEDRSPETIRQILGTEGVQVENINVVPAGLEDAFLYLTRSTEKQMSTEPS